MGVERPSEEEGPGSTTTAPDGDGDAYTSPRSKDATRRTKAYPSNVGEGRPAHILVG